MHCSQHYSQLFLYMQKMIQFSSRKKLKMEVCNNVVPKVKKNDFLMCYFCIFNLWLYFKYRN